MSISKITDDYTLKLRCIVCLFLARQPPVGYGLLISEVYSSHTTTHDSRKDSSGRVVCSFQRPLPDNTRNRHSSPHPPTPPVGFEPKISAGKRPQTHALDRAATGTGEAEYYKPHLLWLRHLVPATSILCAYQFT